MYYLPFPLSCEIVNLGVACGINGYAHDAGWDEVPLLEGFGKGVGEEETAIEEGQAFTDVAWARGLTSSNGGRPDKWKLVFEFRKAEKLHRE